MKQNLIAFFLFIVFTQSFANDSTVVSSIEQNVEIFKKSFSKGISDFKVSEKKLFKTKITYKGEDRNHGMIDGYPESQYSVWLEEGKIRGFILVSKKTKEAYTISSNEKKEIVFTSVSADELICIEYNSISPQNASPAIEEILPEDLPPVALSSLPGSQYVMYLDFDGYELPAGTSWNSGQALSASASGYSDQKVTDVWSIISEDYAPYMVNVTTDEAEYNAAAPGKRMRAVFTNTSAWYPTAGGVAYRGSFSLTGTNMACCWIFVDRMGGSHQSAAEAASHELGHTVGLQHDGTSVKGYYGGHNNWGPLMGTGYGRAVSQFSIGEYTDANNHEDDLNIISNYVPFKVDDFSNTPANANDLIFNVVGNTANVSAVDNKGIINSRTDYDVFKVSSAGGGMLDLVIKPSATVKTNLDVEVKLFDANNTLLDTKGSGHVNLLNGATISYFLSAGKTYYVQLDGVGTGDPLTGWSDYNSMGPYTISGTIAGMQPKQYDLAVTKISLMNSAMCGDSIFPSVEVTNNGSQNINDFTIEVLLNNTTLKTTVYSQLINSNTVLTLKLDGIKLNTVGQNKLTVKVTKPNNLVDEESSNDLLDYAFTKYFGSELTFKISEFSIGANINWDIKENGATITDNAAVSTNSINGFREQKFCLLPDKCYDFNITNAFGGTAQYAAWSAGTIYNTGNKFIYNGRLYEAKQQIWNANPISFPQYYTDLGVYSNTKPTDYFVLYDEGQQAVLSQKTVEQYQSPYSETFCLMSTSAKSLPNNMSVSVYPNPSNNGVFSIQGLKVGSLLKVYNQLGDLVMKETSLHEVNNINLSFLPDGIYFLQAGGNNQRYSKVLVVSIK